MNFRIASWNLERPRRGRDVKIQGLHNQINSIGADVWIFSESSAHVSPGDGYFGKHSKHIDGYAGHTEGEVRSSIWSRYPIKQQIPTDDPETSVCLEVDAPLGSLIIYSTVIPYHNAGVSTPYRNNLEFVTGLKQWELHSQSIERHREEWQRIRSDYPNSHFCAAGDFNQNRDGRHWYGTNAIRHQLSDALTGSDLRCVTEEDFRASKKLESRSSVIHICLNSSLAGKVAATGAWEAGVDTNNKRLSDHNGVWADLSSN